jgi:hypothetical protein
MSTISIPIVYISVLFILHHNIWTFITTKPLVDGEASFQNKSIWSCVQRGPETENNCEESRLLGCGACRLQPPTHAGSSLADIPTLNMEAIRSSETSVHTRSTRRHIPEDSILHSNHCENLKSYKNNCAAEDQQQFTGLDWKFYGNMFETVVLDQNWLNDLPSHIV